MPALSIKIGITFIKKRAYMHIIVLLNLPPRFFYLKEALPSGNRLDERRSTDRLDTRPSTDICLSRRGPAAPMSSSSVRKISSMERAVVFIT